MRVSTTVVKSVGDSKPWPSGWREPLKMARPQEARRLHPDDVKEVERALKHVYQVILPSILKQTSPGWGPGPLSSERSWEFFVSLADELGEWAQRLIEGQYPTGASIRRIERRHLEDAAGELVTVVRRMPPPVRRVVEARAVGVKWKRLTAEMPDRAYFSMVDDYDCAIATIFINFRDVVRRLS